MTPAVRAAALAGLASVAACSITTRGGVRLRAGPTPDAGDAWARDYEDIEPAEPLVPSTENPLVETAASRPLTPEEEAALRVAAAIAVRWIAKGRLLVGLTIEW